MKSFREQYKECKESGNTFIIDYPSLSDSKMSSVVVCVKYKTHCHSNACFEERKNKE